MKKVMICADLKTQSLDTLSSRLKKENWQGVGEIHLVHSFEKHVYAGEFFISSFPNETQYPEIEESVLEVLTKLEHDIFRPDNQIPIIKKCLISSNAKDNINHYAMENNIDEMYVATRGMHGIAGLFTSSFAEYMIRHSQCELHILRE